MMFVDLLHHSRCKLHISRLPRTESLVYLLHSVYYFTPWFFDTFNVLNHNFLLWQILCVSDYTSDTKQLKKKTKCLLRIYYSDNIIVISFLSCLYVCKNFIIILTIFIKLRQLWCNCISHALYVTYVHMFYIEF